ncbi:bifunctional ADP-dependent NAD(P)H-hydrate dehydratase/NAD(P)H-hydrate epimerase [Psychrobacter lutiphocae]|uniref:bifunctional ADP-dependent NAD(P)H-hydrate dehydratase/NAD(P)H-hydrate epimerase n=1 Tax=Psychrobacter lutiphocae TaxID=540500 RepID=UPI00037D7412|nr:bifunctional ADP-dependent NAD(P)H-hydrate dehydratase/NAD(P)H-hydrate epimerase [Psychrobacter lutiphocae]
MLTSDTSATSERIPSVQVQVPQKSLPLFVPKQVYAIEKQWFAQGNPSYGLMQQAAWQMAQWIDQTYHPSRKVSVWVGNGNNGGDGWLVACYLTQMGRVVQVIEVAEATSTDAISAKYQAIKQGVRTTRLLDILPNLVLLSADIMIDALFGIGLDRAPKGQYAEAIVAINKLRGRQASYQGRHAVRTVISLDVPSGLVCSTGQVFDGCAVKADVTLCLVARKLGLHIKDGPDYSGQVLDFPLIPSVLEMSPTARLLQGATPMTSRAYNSHKGSFGHALIIGGNQVAGSQGMGGAALLSASSALSAGVGKLTVACHSAFHGSLITKLPNAMSLNLQDVAGVKALIAECDTVAIGMGMGRDTSSLQLCHQYLQAVLDSNADLIIDADGLFHLATLTQTHPQLIKQLQAHANTHQVWYTPHSGEAARLLNITSAQVEADRVSAISQLAQRYQGSWLLKGVGSLVLDQQQLYVCAAGNPGMATAGMGDVLSGLALGLLAQVDLSQQQRSLQQAVMIHALAGDLGQQRLGEWALQANDMAALIGIVLKQLYDLR